MQQRREFLQQMTGLAIGAAGLSSFGKADWLMGDNRKTFFEISLAEWSFHKSIFSGKMSNLDFPEKAKKEFGISVVEYVNQLFKDKANDTKYLDELLKRCNDNGVKNHLIMCDGEGDLGNTDDMERKKAVENHYKWADAAKRLGCKTIRVNAAGKGTREEVAKAAVDGLSRLGEYAGKMDLNVIVENHGGYSSDGKWLAGVMKEINKPNIGTLPDFGNFCIKHGNGACEEEYDRYQGTKELMPYAKGVSAKAMAFDDKGNCIETDYVKMLKIVKDSGWKGYMGIEYEGDNLTEEEGIHKTIALLNRVGAMLG